MRGAEAISSYTSLPRQEAFDIEYWLLEEAKLQRQPKEKPLSRKVALITGSGGGIGRAIADKLIAEGANVIFTDISEEYLDEAISQYSPDQAIACQCDVTDSKSIEKAIQKASIEFGVWILLYTVQGWLFLNLWKKLLKLIGIYFRRSW